MSTSDDAPETSQEQFEVWAHEQGFCLDQIFMSSAGVPENPYQDRDTHLAYEIWQASRAALENAQTADPTPAEPDMKHPRIQTLIAREARKSIELQIVESMLDPDYEAGAIDGEYWTPLHDKLAQRLKEIPAVELKRAVHAALEAYQSRFETGTGNFYGPIGDEMTALREALTKAEAVK